MLKPNRSLSSDKYQFGFNGKEYDEEWNSNTGAMYDYGFRIYDTRISKFLSVDPLTESYPELTPYQFASNTPIWAIDLDGLEAFYIPGTWRGQDQAPQLTLDAVKGVTGNKTGYTANWSGFNDDSFRRSDAEKIAAEIEILSKNSGEPITIIGHSHGGNVGVLVVNILEKKGIKVNYLITINTPVREYQLDEDVDTKHINIYQKRDPVQRGGGNDFDIPDGVLVIMLPGGPIFMNTYNGAREKPLSGEVGFAGRKFDNANNYEVPWDWSNMHNTHNMPELWIEYLDQIINMVIDFSLNLNLELDNLIQEPDALIVPESKFDPNPPLIR